jgi:hypothetical protein
MLDEARLFVDDAKINETSTNSAKTGLQRYFKSYLNRFKIDFGRKLRFQIKVEYCKNG